MSTAPTDSVRLDLPITGMTCAACATRIEKVLNRLPGVAASVNLASEHALVEITAAETTAQQVVAAIEKAGFGGLASAASKPHYVNPMASGSVQGASAPAQAAGPQGPHPARRDAAENRIGFGNEKIFRRFRLVAE